MWHSATPTRTCPRKPQNSPRTRFHTRPANLYQTRYIHPFTGLLCVSWIIQVKSWAKGERTARARTHTQAHSVLTPQNESPRLSRTKLFHRLNTCMFYVEQTTCIHNTFNMSHLQPWNTVNVLRGTHAHSDVQSHKALRMSELWVCGTRKGGGWGD